MAPKTERIYRDACRRSHTILANYLALVAWRNRLEGVCMDRKNLLRYLGLRIMPDQRVEWLKDDIRRMFPYLESLRDHGYYGTGAFTALFIARRPFPEGCLYSSSYSLGIDELRKAKFRVRRVALPSEDRMIGALARAAAGIRT